MSKPIFGALSRAGALFVVLVGLAGCGINDAPRQDQNVKAKWSEVLNQYQRRSDLIPNLVETVKGYAHQESSVLEAVTECAREGDADDGQSAAGRALQSAGLPQFRTGQASLGNQIGRLLVASERYPDLKSNENFLALQAQLEGTENRITVARRDYIEAVQEYNTTLTTIPSAWIAHLFYPNLKERQTFTISEKAQEVPQVKF